MDLVKLETFLSVARTGSFRRSAEELYLTPSTISKHIAWLEDAYNIPLFRRSPLGAELTAEGRLLIPYAQRMLDENRAFLSALRDSDRSGIVRLCAIPPLAMLADYSMFSEFERQYPDLRISISEEHGQAISRLLDNGRYHLGICAAEYLSGELTVHISLKRYSIMVLVPQGHRLARRGSIAFTELAEESFVALPEYTGVPEFDRRLCRDAGIEYRISATVEREENLVMAVSQSQGVALVGSEYQNNNFCRQHETRKTVLLSISPPVHWHLSLARPRNHPIPPPAEKFWTFIRELSESRCDT